MKKFILRNEGISVFRQLRELTGFESTKYDYSFEKIWNKYLHGLVPVLTRAFSDNIEVIVFDGVEVEKKRKKLIKYTPLVLDSYSSLNQHILGVSRTFDFKGKELLYVGARPGYSNIRSQLERIKKKVGNSAKFTLIEDDIYSGGTLQTVLDEADKYGVDIRNVTVCFQVAEKLKIKVPVKAVVKFKPSDIMDLCDPRDFTFGLYEAGLVIDIPNKYPMKNGKDVINAKKKARVPYIYPFVPVDVRVGIYKENIGDFSINIINLNRSLFNQIARIINRQVVLSDCNEFFGDYIMRFFNIGDETLVKTLDLTRRLIVGESEQILKK